MATTTFDEMSTKTSETTVRVVGSKILGYLFGRPRSLWIDGMAPNSWTRRSTVRRSTAAYGAPVINLDNFDLCEIMDDLHYGTDCEWAA